MDNWIILGTLAAYKLMLLGVGLWASNRNKSESDFFLGGRGLGPWVAGLSYAASTSSAWVLLGFSGFVYRVGLSALWMVPGILAGYAAVWLWAGRVLQESSRQQGHLTLTDFLTEFAGPQAARIIRIVASLLIAFCFSFYVAGQFQGAGTAIDGLFATGFTPGVVIGAIVIVAYVFLGGFLAVSVTDTIQGLLIAVVAVILPVVTLQAAGGFSGLGIMLSAAPESYGSSFGGKLGWVAAGFVAGLTATGFGALGQPHLVAWVMAARDRKARLTGAGVAIGWGVLVYSGMAVLGLSARAVFGADMSAEDVFFRSAAVYLPGIFAGIIAAATLSAIMSTVDSQLLVAGAAVSHDLGLGKAFGGRDVLVSRLAILAICTFAVAITLFVEASIFRRILFAWVSLGAAFGPIVVARACRLRPGGAAVLASIFSGFGLSLAYEFNLLGAGPGNAWPTIIPWLAGLIVVFGATRMQPRS